MDNVLADTLKAGLKSAQTIEQKVDALVLAEIAVVDCQNKTSTRVKELVAKDKERENKIAGAKLMAGIIKGLCAVGGPAAAIYICKIAGVVL